MLGAWNEAKCPCLLHHRRSKVEKGTEALLLAMDRSIDSSPRTQSLLRVYFRP